jgi:hypothetical protein
VCAPRKQNRGRGRQRHTNITTQTSPHKYQQTNVTAPTSPHQHDRINISRQKRKPIRTRV